MSVAMNLDQFFPNVKFNGFDWVVRGITEEVCENVQSFRVLRSGEVCVLGTFDQPDTRLRAVFNAMPNQVN
jgi:hypothetical protein